MPYAVLAFVSCNSLFAILFEIISLLGESDGEGIGKARFGAQKKANSKSKEALKLKRWRWCPSRARLVLYSYIQFERFESLRMWMRILTFDLFHFWMKLKALSKFPNRTSSQPCPKPEMCDFHLPARYVWDSVFYTFFCWRTSISSFDFGVTNPDVKKNNSNLV